MRNSLIRLSRFSIIIMLKGGIRFRQSIPYLPVMRSIQRVRQQFGFPYREMRKNRNKGELIIFLPSKK